ncbi:MAG: carboxypeptidase regulatory-like domain-containing protein [Deltaproteobacteria bacterium]|nr:carboxypeptidase regulatory-like domain-containing protein [Deltaproteobacteria bacterium]
MNDAMRWGLGIGGGAAGLAVLALVLFQGPCASDDGAPPAEPTEDGLAADRDAGRAARRPGSPAPQGPDDPDGPAGTPTPGDPGTTRPPGPPGTGALAGLVLDRDGLPGVGAVVTVRPDEGEAPWERFRARRQRPAAGLAARRVDLDGFFRFEGLPAGTVVVEAYGAGLVTAEQRGVVIDPLAEAWVEFTLDAGLTISGRVTDEAGTPIAGAEVSATSRGRGDAFASANADGTYELTGLRAGTFQVEADADGFVGAGRRDVRAGTSGVDFRLGRAGILAGRVIWRGSGSPIEGAVVRAVSPAGRAGGGFGRGGGFGPGGGRGGGFGPGGGRGGGPSGVTDADGRFELTNVAPGRWVVEADAARRVPGTSREVTLPPAGRIDDLQVELGEGARVAGIVVTDGDGRPVADATVSISVGGRSAGPGRGMGALFRGPGAAAEPEPDGELSARTDGSGRFELLHVAAGRRTVVATHAAHPQVQRTVEVPSAGDLTGVELRMPAGGAIAGTVTDQRRGAAVAEAIVVARASGEGRGGGAFGNTQVGAGGSYRLEGLAAGRYEVTVVVPPSDAGGRLRGPEFSVPKEAVVRSGETTTVDFQLGGGTTVSGVVSQAGAPVPGASITFSPEQGAFGGRRSTVADDDGSYVLEDVAPGSYVVRVERTSLRAVVPDVPEHELNLEIPAGAIAGFVRDAATGVGIADARVRARTALAGGAAASPPGAGAGSAETGPDGSFEVTGLAAGSYELQVSHAEYSPGQVTVELPATGRLDGVEVRLEPGVRIGGRVVNEADQPVAEAFVLLLDPQTGAMVPGDPRGRMTGTDGSFELTGVAPGTWKLQASASGYATSAAVAVDASTGAENVVLRVTPGGRVEAVVVDSSGAPVAGVPVALVDPDTGSGTFAAMPGRGAGRSPRSDDGGRVVFEHVRPGTCTLRATPPEAPGTQVQVTVQEGGTTPATLTLPP